MLWMNVNRSAVLWFFSYNIFSYATSFLYSFKCINIYIIYILNIKNNIFNTYFLSEWISINNNFNCSKQESFPLECNSDGLDSCVPTLEAVSILDTHSRRMFLSGRHISTIIRKTNVCQFFSLQLTCVWAVVSRISINRNENYTVINDEMF